MEGMGTVVLATEYTIQAVSWLSRVYLVRVGGARTKPQIGKIIAREMRPETLARTAYTYHYLSTEAT